MFIGYSITSGSFVWRYPISQFRPTSCVCKLCVCRFAKFMAYSLAKFARGVEDEIVWLEESPPLALEALHFGSF